MRKVLKGMIIFFTVVMIGLLAFMVYVLTRGEDVNILGSAELMASSEMPADEISAVEIKGYSEDIIFKESDTEDIIVKEFAAGKAKKRKALKVQKTGDTLKLEIEKRTGSSWFVFGNYHRHIEVYLPASYGGVIDMDVSSGDITSDIDFNVSKFSINASSGYLSLQDVSAEDITIRTSSGDVKTGQLSGEVKIDCTSGYVEAESCVGSLDANTSSGDITIREMIGEVDVESTSGYLKIEKIDGLASANTSSGDVIMDFDRLDGDINVNTSSGYVSCDLPDDAEFDFKADTSSGDIDTYFDDELSYDRRGSEARGTVGKGGKKITVKTSSGDIRFTK